MKKISDKFPQLQKNLGYQFQQLVYLHQALSHRSMGRNNNERLEFLGDALLSAVVAELLYHKYPQAKEGQLTRLRASLVKGETLAKIARELDLGQYLQLGAGELKSGGRRRDSILADGIEAVIGAVYLDGGMSACSALIKHLLLYRIEELSLKDAGKDAKTKLQERLQARNKGLPIYELLSITGQAHEQVFHIKCHVDILNQTVEAKGNSRRKAEQIAAKQILLLLDE